jgi:hypothetical protein
MVASIVLGLLTILQRDFVQHSAWMTRDYTISLGAGTQVVLLLLAELRFGAPM